MCLKWIPADAAMSVKVGSEGSAGRAARAQHQGGQGDEGGGDEKPHGGLVVPVSRRRSLSIESTRSVWPRAVAFSWASCMYFRAEGAVPDARVGGAERVRAAGRLLVLGGERLPEVVDRVHDAPLLDEDAAEVEVGGPVVRLALDRRPVVLRGLVQLPRGHQQVRVVVVGLGVGGLQLQRPAEGLGGLGVLPLAGQQHAVVVVDLGEVRVEGDARRGSAASAFSGRPSDP